MSYRLPLSLLRGSDSASWLMRSYFAQEPLTQETMMASVRGVEDESTGRPQDFLAECRQLIAALIVAAGSFRSLPEPLKQAGLTRLKELEQWGYARTFQLGAAFLDMGAVLLCAASQLPSAPSSAAQGLFKESAGCILDGALPHPVMSAELALIWFYLGVALAKEELLCSALHITHFLGELCDSRHRPFQALWTREAEFCKGSLLASFYLLFKTAFLVSKEAKLGALAAAFEKKIDNLALTSWGMCDPFFFALSLALAEKEETFSHSAPLQVSQGLGQKEKASHLGFFRFDAAPFEAVLTASGVNTGLGTLHKREVNIISLGPHFYPLADAERYGLYRLGNRDQRGFKDIKVNEAEGRQEIAGWSRLVEAHGVLESKSSFSALSPSNQWMWFRLQAEENGVNLTTYFPHVEEENPLAFVFFIEGDQVVIEGEPPLLPGVIERFSGKSCALRVFKGNDELQIVPQEGSAKMDVIPLAGKDHFWGANFLLAFEVAGTNQRLGWTFI